jgi:hypothetical protein
MKQPTQTSRHPRTRPNRPANRFPGLEPLEHRHLLSVALSEIDSTLPGDGDALLKSPQQFVINLDPGAVTAIDDSLSGLLGYAPAQTFPALIALDGDTLGNNDEFAIYRVGADGLATPFLGTSSSPLQVAVTTVADSAGTTIQSQMIITPAAGDPSLLPGTYQIDIEPGTSLDAAFSQIDTSPAWTSSQPITIAQFTVLGRGRTLGDATHLGDIGPTTLSVTGFVDPQGSQSQVALYQFTLPPGHSWQLNAQVLAQSIGSPLNAGLSLFDSNGDVVTTSNSGQGLASNWKDPSLIQGLAPGTYYLGISASGNLPGRPNGYDLKTGTPGTSGFDGSDGAFRLNLVASPAVGSTTLTSHNLDYSDPLEPSPTGLDLTFSGPIDATSLFAPDQQETALEVVDSWGQVWPITPVNYQTSTHTLNFIFDESLPAGSYSLVDPAQGGLTDLSGLPLVVPAGNPPGVMASWTVAPTTGSSDPDNLGVIWPGPVNVTWNSAITRTTDLTAGQDTTYRFVVICPGVYEVQTEADTGQIDLDVTGAGGTTELDAPGLTGLNHSLMNLSAGVYSMTVADDGSQSAGVQWTLKPIVLDYEKVIENGVGQSPVLTLVVTAPGADSQSGATANPGAANAVPTAATYGSSSNAGSNLSTLGASPIPTSLLVSMNTGLMGSPGANTQNVAAVGPMAEGALASVADRANGLLPGIRYASWSDSETSVGNGDTPEVNGDTPEVLDFMDEPRVDPQETVSMAAKPANPEAASARNDGRALARADRLVRIATWVEDFLGLRSRIEPDAGPADEGRAIAAVAVGDHGESGGMPRGPVTADLDSSHGGTPKSLVLGDLRAPMGLIVTVAVACRLRRPIEKWWRRNAPNSARGLGRPHLHHLFDRGPHSRIIHARTTYRPQMPRTPC